MSLIIAGHRGFKAKCPENTILAYDAAVDAGCNVVETDLHISTDHVIVIAHDIMTRRVYGESYNVSKVSYKDTLSKLRTVEEPHLPMATFLEILKWCREKSESTGRNITLMLDIKRDCQPKLLLDLIQQDLAEVGPSVEYWHPKLIFGMWDPRYYTKAMDPFSIINITFDLEASKGVVSSIKAKGGKVSAISMFYLSLYDRSLSNQMKTFCKQNQVKIWWWTVNDKQVSDDVVKYCALPNDETLLAGLITDDPVGVHKPDPNYGIVSRISRFFKVKCYLLFLYLLHNKYNMDRIFDVLKKVGLL